MARAISQLPSGLTVGYAKLGRHGAKRGTVAQQVHDGDTVVVEADGNLGVRFLGVDTPEVSFTLPPGKAFVALTDPAWEPVLADPFSGALPPFIRPLSPQLQTHLQSRVGPGTAANHARLAEGAHRALESEVAADLESLGGNSEEFRFFLAFAGEVMDRYGRLLGYLNRHQPSATSPAPRPRSYNERMLQSGWALPYFIWPNINPFRHSGSLLDAVPQPGTAADLAEQEGSLRDARRWVADARSNQMGCYDPTDPLRLLPFELRFLAQRRPPDRWVIDLSRNDDILVAPQAYFEIPNPEDRLFVPTEFVPLYTEAGWKRA